MMDLNFDTDIFEFVYAPLADNAAKRNGVPADLFRNLIRSESSFNPDAYNPSGATGIAQFMPPTAAEMGIDPTDPVAALEASAAYLKKMYNKYGNWRDAISQYKGYGNNLSAGYSKADKVLKNTDAGSNDLLSKAGVGSLEQIIQGATGKPIEKLKGKSIWQYTLEDWKTFLQSSMLGFMLGLVGVLIILLSIYSIFKKQTIIKGV